jgi:hypothetical protein
MDTNGFGLFNGTLKSVIIGIISSVILTLLFGNSVPGTIFKELIRGGLEATGVEVGKNLGPSVIAGVLTMEKKVADWFGQGRASYIVTPRANGHGPQCGTDPNGQVYCCDNPERQFVIGYSGPWSPYQYGGISYWRTCW